ncbi:MAG: hypothetical protein OIF57_15010 [Marinobacterium sp.]|nr:hypothetical protein [Marinobacterium sp.]
MQPLFTSVDELNQQPELFYDPARTVAENTGPFIIVCDDFYPDPLAVRKLALAQPFFQYKPPLAEQVGEAIAAQYPDPTPVWESSALYRYLGTAVKQPQSGYRHASADVRELLSQVTHEQIVMDSWHQLGDGWNGAFHLQYEAGENVHRVIHHHYRQGDVVPRGWSGLVYLSPDAPAEHGTTIWRHRESQRCVAPMGNLYEQDRNQFELMLAVENRFNRLVLFRENVLHRAGHGFGSRAEDARLMQTFFFQTVPQTGLSR